MVEFGNGIEVGESAFGTEGTWRYLAEAMLLAADDGGSAKYEGENGLSAVFADEDARYVQ